MATTFRQLLTLLVLATAILLIPLVASARGAGIPQVGESAPDVTLPNQDGASIQLSALWAESPLVVYFYPANFTPG